MKPRLLILLPYVPFPLRRGTYQRVYHLAEILANHYEADLFCLSHETEDNDHRARFEDQFRRVFFQPFRHPPWPKFWTERLWHSQPTTLRHWQCPDAHQAFRQFINGQSYDLVWFCDLVLWPYVQGRFPATTKRVLDRSRVDWLFQTEELATLTQSPLQRLMRRENLWKIARVERELARSLDLMIVCGPDDKTFLENRLGPLPNLHVLPNGANETYFDEKSCPPTPTACPSALFCGALDYVPNVDCLRWYAKEIHPRILTARPDFSLKLVGKNPTPEIQTLARQPGIDFIGEVPDVRPYYQQAWFQIVPLRIGGGTRLKIAEGLCLGNPVVSTSLGAQGLDLDNGRHLLLADNAPDFAEACLCLIADFPLRQRLGEAGRTRILERYTWSALGEQLIATLNNLCPASP